MKRRTAALLALAAVLSPLLALRAAAPPPGAAYDWGDNRYGQLGNGTLAASPAPVAVFGLGSGVTAIAAGYAHDLAIQNGAVYAWGYNGNGQLGNGATVDSLTPVPVLGLTSGVTAVAAGSFHSLAIQNGALYAWGYNGDGELGNGTASTQANPTLMPVLGLTSGVTAAAAFYFHSLAVMNGAAYAWGYNGNGELGNGTISTQATPVPAAVLSLNTGVTAVAAGYRFSLAVQNGAAYAWGYNNAGQLGSGTLTDSSAPVAVPGLTSGVTAVAAGYAHSLALVNGHVYAWGDNSSGQLGSGTLTGSSVPVEINPADLQNITAVAAGSAASYALASDGSLWVWGDNSYGELGLGTATPQYLAPQRLPAPGGYTYTAIAANAYGQFASAILSPIPVPVITSAASGTGQVGAAFAYQITATNGAASYAASGLPPGLSLNPATGLVSGTPTQAGTFSVGLSAANAGGTGTITYRLSIAPLLPVVTLAATVPKAVLGSGQPGVFTVTLSAPQDHLTLVHYTIKGSAVNGTDYVLLTGIKKFKPGRTSKPINIVPLGNLGGAALKTVKLTLAPDPAYNVGTAGFVKVKIVAGP